MAGMMLVALLTAFVPVAAAVSAQPFNASNTGMALPPGYTLGPYGKLMPASQMPKVVPRWYYNQTNQPGGTGIALPQGYTLGPYGKIVPVSQAKSPGSALNDTTKTIGITYPKGYTLGPYGRTVPANQTKRPL